MYKSCPIKIFALNSSREFGERVVSSIGKSLSEHVEIDFPDSEVKICPSPEEDGNCRERDVFVIQSLYNEPRKEDIYRKFVKLLIFNNATRHASAARITNVIPYLVHSRQDRKTDSREPLSGQVILSSLINSGANKILGCTWHSPALQNALYIPCDVLDAYTVLSDYILEKEIVSKDSSIVLVAPDTGALKGIVEPLHKRLSKKLDGGVYIAAVDKKREGGKKIESRFLIGDVKDRIALIPDDESVTGDSLNNAAQKVLGKGAKEAVGIIAHCKIFESEYLEKINNGPLKKIIITDTIYRDKKFFEENPKFELCSVAPLFGKAIIATHDSKSISQLYE